MSNNEAWGEEHLRPLYEWPDERRIDIIGTNGGDGAHYPQPPQASWRDHFARHGGKLANTDEKC